jgi:NADH-quinone oxidoreductase subunit M
LAIPIAPLAAKNVSSSAWLQGDLRFYCSFETKDLKETILTLYYVGPLLQVLTLTIDGLRGAVLQMIAHGCVVVGLFISEIIFRRYETRTIAEMGGIRTITKFASMFLLLVLASVALPTTFNFVGEFTYYTAFLKLMFGLPF